MPLPKTTRSERLLWFMAFGLAIGIALPLTPAAAEDATTRAVHKVTGENYAASDAEDMPRLLKTMRVGLPNRDLLIGETLKEWDAADTSTRLVESVVRDRGTAHYFPAVGRAG